MKNGRQHVSVDNPCTRSKEMPDLGVGKSRALVWGNPGPRCREIPGIGDVTSHFEPLTRSLRNNIQNFQ